MISRKSLQFLVFVSLVACSVAVGARAQVVDRIQRSIDPAQTQPLANHHPVWAVAANDAGPVPANLPIQGITLVLARPSQQEQAFEQLLRDQQDPSSPEYHHWLTSNEIGERYGSSENDIAALTGWLQSQGLQVSWVAPSRTFIGFTGTAANVGRAFQTELRYYTVNGKQRMSVSSEPMIPSALAPAIRSIRGLFTIEERPSHIATTVQSSSPNLTISSGGVTYHFLAPGDFATIYDLPASLTGSGTTIGIVAEARTDVADFTNFRSLTGSTFATPTEVIPTAYGGVDPGPAYITSQSCSGSCTLLDYQAEATLDVMRAGSVAPGATLLSVVASAASGGIGDDAQYIVQSTPTPAQVMTISFGACELEVSSQSVDFWDGLFEQAAGEGISVFVSSGDSAASGCDTAFTTPPASPNPNSPNYICSSSYATCVGGTEFNDASNPTVYWNASNGTGLKSVISYIPEGAWNEPLNSSSAPQVAGTGGGVSTVILTPSWQTGTGVPAARAGRYTPDVAFSSADHDGYFACFAAGGGTCVDSGGSTPFSIFSGTSAAAPAMAGVAALLDQSLSGAAQGNLNPQIYAMAASTPAAFHQISVASSGVSNCNVSMPSMCNNSVAGPTGLTGGQAGFLLGATGGYSEATGLGSLDVTQFINNYSSNPKFVPTVTLMGPPAVSVSQSASVLITVTGNSSVPTGTVTLSSGTYESSSSTLDIPGTNSNGVYIVIPSGVLALGTDTITANYSSSSSSYNSASGSTTINVTSPTKTPTVTVTPSPSSVSTTQSLVVAVAVAGAAGNPTATGSVVLTGGGYTSAATALSGGSASIIVPAGSLSVGIDPLTATYTPDTNSSTVYVGAAGSGTVDVTAATKTNPNLVWNTPVPIAYGTPLGAAQLDATASVAGTFAYSPAAGAVLTSGSQNLSVNFTPTDSTDYATASSIVTLTVNKATPAITWATPAAITYGTMLSVAQLDPTSNASGTFAFSPPAGTLLTAGQQVLMASFTPTDTTNYNATSATVTLTVNKATPTITWATPAAVAAGTALTSAQLNAAPSVLGTLVYTPPLGTIMSTTGNITLSASFTPNDTVDYNDASATTTLIVNPGPPPTFAVTGNAITVEPGATIGNTSTILVTPSNGFTGAVSLTCAITPAAANDPATCNILPSSVTINGTTAQTATLTVSTTLATALNHPFKLFWPSAGGATLALAFLFRIPRRRRNWIAMLGLFCLFVSIAGIGCGGGTVSTGGGGGGGGGGGSSNPGTTAGTYTITITGTSGSTVVATTDVLTVQ
jgi:subtilase family serine protease